MDVAKMLAELRQERERIEQAISSMELLVRSRGSGRGRPPAWIANPPRKRGRPPGSRNKTSAKSVGE
jgi:hypothetical protein